MQHSFFKRPLFFVFGFFILLISACSASPTQDPKCDESRRCTPQSAKACGVDGKTYACESYATCLGVNIDDTGQACSTQKCPDVLCDIDCPFGNAVDDNGCATCSCNPPQCPERADYCQTCDRSDATCNGCCENSCPDIGCLEPVFCERYKRDAAGCQTCECDTTVTCEPVACDLFCDNGFKTDESGCDICECNEQVSCPPTPDYCLNCDRDDENCEQCCGPIACPDEDDESFCENCDPNTTTCRECCDKSCPDIACPPGGQPCPYGPKYVNGCYTCECAEPPACNAQSDCEFHQNCEEQRESRCCPEGETCTDDQPPCPSLCINRFACRNQSCGDGLRCEEVQRDDCCPSNADCAANIPSCQFLCVP